MNPETECERGHSLRKSSALSPEGDINTEQAEQPGSHKQVTLWAAPLASLGGGHHQLARGSP